MIERFYKQNSTFVFVRVSAEISIGQVSRHILAYNQETEGRSGLLELCDCRGVTSTGDMATPTLVKTAALEVGSARIEAGRLAVVVANQLLYGFAHAFAMFARENGRAVSVCYDVDEAIRFLQTAESVEEIQNYMRSC